MSLENYRSEHTFHIPVMGLAYTIDSPIKVARFGISSVMSIIEDRLVEMMRRHYYPQINKSYFPISHHEPDYRAKRITDYLNLVNEIVRQQMIKMKAEVFEKGSEIVRYFEMLPDGSRSKDLFVRMMHCTEYAERKIREDELRNLLIPGSIDVNILTKTDRENRDRSGNIIPDGSDAVAALRGYINSDLTHSAIVFSAGMNPRLYSYLEKSSAFDPDKNGHFSKRVIVKVSDFRSALIQGKFLAKKGIWVSEFRIESGLNCGGHAFATDGFLLGPILEEFKSGRQELLDSISEIYRPAISRKLGYDFNVSLPIETSVQGGIGSAEEDQFLRSNYQISSTGWGTPFLLVPEATTVDDHTLGLLGKATEKDVFLSKNSPLGVRFHYLKGTTADLEKSQRIKDGKPGSPCVEKHLGFNTEFTSEPICTASTEYQQLKLEQLKSLNLSAKELEKQTNDVLAKECLCVGLSTSAAIKYEHEFLKNRTAVNICPGPNIVNFSSVVSLKTMIDHIYGRDNIITNKSRPHVFIAELKLYLNYLSELMIDENDSDGKRLTFYEKFVQNLTTAIQYYKSLPKSSVKNHERFISDLLKTENELKSIMMKLSPV